MSKEQKPTEFEKAMKMAANTPVSKIKEAIRKEKSVKPKKL